MNKLILMFGIAICCISCKTTYYFAQVYQAECENRSQTLADANPNVMYEDENCIVYYQMWGEKGDAGFGLYNKTDKILYIDLTKSFFICNGVSYPYYQGRVWGKVTSSSSLLANVNTTETTNIFGRVLANSSANTIATGGVNVYSTGSTTFVSDCIARATSISISEMPTLAIAPKTSAWVGEYRILDAIFLDCDLQHYPSTSSFMEFNKETTPLHFGNFITYNLGEGTPNIEVQNKLYVSKISNYAWPSLVTYIKREHKPCQNVTNSTSHYYSNEYAIDVYDAILNINTTNSFYIPFERYTSNKLYKKDRPYYYREEYDGYTRGE